MKIRNVAISSIVENSWNPNRVPDEMMRALEESIVEYGFVQPLVVRPKGEAFEVIDGAHRLRALKKIGFREIECVIVDDTDEDAKMRTVLMDRLRGSFDHEKLAELVASLEADEESIRRSLAYSEEQFEEIKSLLDSGGPEEFEVPEEELYELMDFYLPPGDADTVRAALRAAGEKERAPALVKIAKEYLDARTR